MRRRIGLASVASVGLVTPSSRPAVRAESPTVVTGMGQVDVITGMNGPQIIYGRGGDDRINGGKGPDVIYGGPGDRLATEKRGATAMACGGRGNDVVKDFTSGRSGGTLVGGPGRDCCRKDAHDIVRGAESSSCSRMRSRTCAPVLREGPEGGDGTSTDAIAAASGAFPHQISEGQGGQAHRPLWPWRQKEQWNAE